MDVKSVFLCKKQRQGWLCVSKSSGRYHAAPTLSLLHSQWEISCALIKSEAAKEPFAPKLHKQVQFTSNFGDLKRIPAIFKFSLENLTSWDRRKKFLVDVAVCSGVRARDMQNILLPLAIIVILESRNLPEIWSISKWKYSGNCFKIEELDVWTKNLSLKKKKSRTQSLSTDSTSQQCSCILCDCGQKKGAET